MNLYPIEAQTPTRVFAAHNYDGAIVLAAAEADGSSLQGTGFEYRGVMELDIFDENSTTEEAIEYMRKNWYADDDDD